MINPKTNPTRARGYLWPLTLLPLISTAGAVSAVPIDGSHHAPTASAAAPEYAKIVIKPSSTLTTNTIVMGQYGSNVISVIEGKAIAMESAACFAQCDLDTPITSPIHYVGSGARITVHADWSLPHSEHISIELGSPEHTDATPGAVVVSGALTAAPEGITINAIGNARKLPVRLITAHAISGPFRPGILPPGTSLQVTPSGITLIKIRR